MGVDATCAGMGSLRGTGVGGLYCRGCMVRGAAGWRHADVHAEVVPGGTPRMGVLRREGRVAGVG